MHGIPNGTGNKLLGWDEFGAKDGKHYGESPTGRKRVRRSKKAVLSKLKGVKTAKKRKKKHSGNPY